MEGYKSEREFREWQAAVALQYGLEVISHYDRRQPIQHGSKKLEKEDRRKESV